MWLGRWGWDGVRWDGRMGPGEFVVMDVDDIREEEEMC